MKSPLPSRRTSPVRPPEPWPVSRGRWEAARAVLLVERLSPTLIRAAGVGLAFAAAALFGLPEALPPLAAWGLLLLAAGSLTGLA
jgi:hypothetical protein